MTLSDKTNNGHYPISAVIFDVDGVLVDTVPLHFSAWQKVFDEERISFGKKEYQLINGIPRDEGVRIILGAAATPDRIRDIGDRKQNYYLALLNQMPPRPLPGIARLLRDLRKTGLRVAAASSSKNAVAVLAAAHLAPYFDTIVTGYDFQRPKPDPDIFLTAAKILKVIPADTVVVEDAAQGIRAAHAGGFQCIAVATSESMESLRAAGTSVVVSSTKKLASCIFA